MNKLTQAILNGIACVIDRRKATPVGHRTDFSHDGGRAYHRAVSNHQLAEHDITPVDLEAFLGVQPTASERTRASRAYIELERLGFVERLTERFSSRTSAIRLLPAGRAALSQPGSVAPADTSVATSDPQPSEPSTPAPAEGGSNV